MVTTTREPMRPMPRSGPRGTPLAASDSRKAFAASVEQHPIDGGLKAAFISNRRQMALTHPILSALQRSRAIVEFDGMLPLVADDLGAQPVPGGVGYGMFYSGPFKSAFQSGTSIYWEVVCPSLPGGNVSTYLYLTATNRAAMGVEALVAYNGQSNPSFLVYDWARDPASRWQFNLPFNLLRDYLSTDVAHSSAFQALPVMNMTFMIGSGSWANQVWLINHSSDSWDLIYQFEYVATITQQLGQWPGSWGPIVETFQDKYSGTNDLGALNTQFSSQHGGQWSAWSPLSQGDAQLRVDNKGFLPEFLDPNTSWVVRS